ncbi:hypothetical protein GOP47_0026248 [Adiantum capillus-veneris]|nr:hypothetical protein GOP47_0026248 [Adiantum capillus-veneris]
MASCKPFLLVAVSILHAALSVQADQPPLILPISNYYNDRPDAPTYSIQPELRSTAARLQQHAPANLPQSLMWNETTIVDDARLGGSVTMRKLSEKKNKAKFKKYMSIYKSRKSKKAKKIKKKPSSGYYKPKKSKKRPRPMSYYYKPKVKVNRKKVGSKAKYIKNKVVNKGRRKSIKYKPRNPVPTNYLPKGRSNNMMNRIDECWRNDPNWADNRMHLADCAIGYGFDASGGKGGELYVVTDPSDDPASPNPGTLRHGVVQMRPLWIIFDHDMTIKLENELIMTSYKTIDGRGARVEIAHGPCFTIQYVDHIIIHGLSIHHCTPGKSGRVMSSTQHVGQRQGSDGDAINMFGASHIWIDHNYFAECQDGLVDAIHGSTAITISNNLFTNHDKVMLLGHSDSYSEDENMRVTLVYNHFGPGLIQRMPRCRFGYFHIANNRYTKWGMYAIGASANPTIKSEGNYFLAPDEERFKQVVKLEGAKETSSSNWKSSGDLFLNGAYFGEDGTSNYQPSYPYKQENFDALPASLVPLLTANVGPLNCGTYSRC